MIAPGRPKRSFLARSATVSPMLAPGRPKRSFLTRSARFAE